MTKLRLFRKRETESKNDDVSDLRGLGNDPALQESTPIIVLSIHADHQTTPNVTRLFTDDGFEVDSVQSKNGMLLHVTKSGRQSISHKEQSIFLYAKALELGKALPPSATCSIAIWQAEPLAHYLKQNKESEAKAFEVKNAFPPDCISWDSFLTIHSPISLYLTQAGFSGLPSKVSDNVRLTRKSVVELFSKETELTKVQEKKWKAEAS